MSVSGGSALTVESGATWAFHTNFINSNGFNTALFALFFINALILTVFSALSVTEIIISVDWFKPGFYAFLYTLVAGVGILAHVVGLIWMLTSSHTPKRISPANRTRIYVLTVLYVLVFTVNMILAWSFYGKFCSDLSPAQNDGKTGIFNCISPTYLDPDGNLQTLEYLEVYFWYQNIQLVAAALFPALLYSIFVLKVTLLGDETGPVVKQMLVEQQQLESTPIPNDVKTASHVSLAYFWVGTAFYLALTVFSALAYIETLYVVDILEPFPLALAFTIVGGTLLIATIVTLALYAVQAAKTIKTTTSARNVPMWLKAHEPIAHAVRTLAYFAAAFVVYLIALWMFYGKHCFDADGVYIEDCTHPIELTKQDPLPDEATENLYGFTILNAFWGLLLPLNVFMLVKHFYSTSERGFSLLQHSAASAQQSK